MNRRLFGSFGVLAVLVLPVGSCKSDPLSDVDGTPAGLYTDFSYLEVNVGAALPVTATVIDARSTPLEVVVTFRTCNATVTVGPDTSFHPLPPTTSRTLVHGVTYGTSCVIAEYAGLSDTVQIATFPASIVVLGPDTIISGQTGAFTHEYRDAIGGPVAGVPAPTWASADTLLGTITAANGVLSGRDTGLVTIRVTGTGSPAAGVIGTKQVVVRPAAFTPNIVPNPADPGQVVTLIRAPTGPIFDANTAVRFGTSAQAFVAGSLTPDSVKVAIPDVAAGGVLSVAAARLGPTQITQSGGVFTVNTPAALAGSVSPSSGLPGTRVVIKRTSGPVFDANTRVYFGGVRTFISVVAADSIVAPVPGVGAKGSVELRLTRLDATDLARQLPFTADTGAFLLADQYDAVNNDPTTAPVITANGDYFVVLSGGCANGGGGTDCDDWFKITNNGGATATVAINAAWLAGPDIDILLGSDPDLITAFDCEDGCGGATGANPENTSIDVPAGATYYLWLNLFSAGGAASTVARVRVSGLP